MTKSTVSGTKIPPGALITALHRSVHYTTAASAIHDDGTLATLADLDELGTLSLIESVQPEVCEQRRKKFTDQRDARVKAQRIKQEPNGLSAFDSVLHSHDILGASSTTFTPDMVRTLKGHEKEVFACSWNPTREILATASGDSTARMWSLEDVSGRHHRLYGNVTDRNTGGKQPHTDPEAHIQRVP